MVERFQQTHPYKNALNFVYHLRNVSYLLEDDHEVSTLILSVSLFLAMLGDRD